MIYLACSRDGRVIDLGEYESFDEAKKCLALKHGYGFVIELSDNLVEEIMGMYMSLS